MKTLTRKVHRGYSDNTAAKSVVGIGLLQYPKVHKAPVFDECFFCARVMVGCMGVPSGTPLYLWSGKTNPMQSISLRLVSDGDGFNTHTKGGCYA